MNGNPDVIPRFHGQAGVRDYIFGADLNNAALIHGLPRIEQHVMQHLAHLAGVEFGRPEIVIDAEVDADWRARSRQVHGVFEKLRDTAGTPNRRSSLCERQQLRGQRSRAIACGNSLLQHVADRIARLCLSHRQSKTALHDG